jgi:hypothetical protein
MLAMALEESVEPKIWSRDDRSNCEIPDAIEKVVLVR